MLVKSKVGPWCSTPLFLPSVSTLVQVMFGVGLPEASQNNCRFECSLIVWSPLTLVRIAGTENNHTSAQFTYITFVTKITELNIYVHVVCVQLHGVTLHVIAYYILKEAFIFYLDT